MGWVEVVLEALDEVNKNSDRVAIIDVAKDESATLLDYALSELEQENGDACRIEVRMNTLH